MKMLKRALPILALFFASSCQPAKMVIDPELEELATAMPVKGRQGFQIGQRLSFGNYQTGKVKRGWTKGYDIPFRIRFQGAGEKLSFDIMDDNGATADVSCINKFRMTEFQLVRDYFSTPLKVKHFFAGNILLENGAQNWDFIVYNPEGALMMKGGSFGYAQNGKNRIEIMPIRDLEGQPRWLGPLSVYGYTFQVEDKTIGAVSLVNKGEVWMVENIDADHKMVISSLAAGLLLRSSITEHNENL